MKIKPTVTIVASVLNEEANISFFLRDILSQNLNHFMIQEIQIISDGSTDSTVQLATSIKDKRIHVTDHKTRKGKTARINQAITSCKTDILVILDADIRLEENCLQNLLNPFLEDEQVVLTSGNALPFAPVTFSEHLAWISDALWKHIVNGTAHSDMYHCEGKIRALHHRLYSNIQFPLASADDVYPYLQAMKMNFKFVYNKEAIVHYQLPITWNDYVNQNVRFLQSKDIQNTNFDKETIKAGYVIGKKEKLFGLLTFFPLHPFWTSMYILSAIITKTIALLPYDDKQGKWNVVTSTKRLRKNI